MLLPLRLLIDKDDANPGDAVAIEDFISISDFYIKPSGDLTSSGDIELSAEVSDSPNGPWKSFGIVVGNVNTANAGKLITATMSAINNRWLGYVRLVLSDAPLTGSVTVDLYAKV